MEDLQNIPGTLGWKMSKFEGQNTFGIINMLEQFRELFSGYFWMNWMAASVFHYGKAPKFCFDWNWKQIDFSSNCVSCNFVKESLYIPWLKLDNLNRSCKLLPWYCQLCCPIFYHWNFNTQWLFDPN